MLPILYFYPAVKGDLALMMGDAWAYSILMKAYLGEMISQGKLPLWNPHIFAGMPFLAAIQSGSLYPPNWLFAALSPGVALNVVVISTYHLALIGSYLFGRYLGLTRIRMSLYDSATGKAISLDTLKFPKERWRKLASFGLIEVYENLCYWKSRRRKAVNQ